MRAGLRETLPLCLLVAVVFVCCYGTASWLAAQQSSLPVWDFPFEQRIPFVPATSVVYLTIIPALMLGPFVFRTRREITPFVVVLCAETIVASILFLLFPQTTSFIRPDVTGWAGIPFGIADAVNLQYNQFPSLHVAFACTAAWAYSKRTGFVGRTLWATWAVAVAASTWLMWEHHLVDIAGGVVLAALAMTVLYPRLDWIELCCLWQCAQFSRRHFRYFIVFLFIYVPSLRHWRRYRAVRVAFCTLQWIDDLLDGDRASARDPMVVVNEALAGQSGSALGGLTATLLEELRLFRNVQDDPESDFRALVRTMQRDRDRMLRREVWTDEELTSHHRTTFSLSVNLMLITAGCRTRAQEVPDLIDAFAWCSVFRDLDDDLRKGLINIPRRVWEQRSGYEQWARDSHRQACEALDRSAATLARLDDPRACTILAIFQRSITRYAGSGLGSDPKPPPETHAIFSRL